MCFVFPRGKSLSGKSFKEWLHLRADKSSYGSLEFLQQFHLFELLFSFWQSAFFELNLKSGINPLSFVIPLKIKGVDNLKVNFIDIEMGYCFSKKKGVDFKLMTT